MENNLENAIDNSTIAGPMLSLEVYSVLVSAFLLVVNPNCTSHALCLLTSIFGFVSAVGYALLTEVEYHEFYTIFFLWGLMLANVTHTFVPVLRIWHICKSYQKKIFIVFAPISGFLGAYSSSFCVIDYRGKNEFSFELLQPAVQLSFFLALVIVSVMCLLIVFLEFKYTGLPRITKSLRIFEKIAVLSLFLVISIQLVQSGLVIAFVGNGQYSFVTHLATFFCTFSQAAFEINRLYSLKNDSVNFVEGFHNK
eukprot:NODE_9_length_64580_cov_1.431941.p34 type:complete len:253 gc:universal NODE_9_length_64580_cov_1.431941:35812-35054(-)